MGGDEVKVIDRNGKKGFELNLLWLNKVSEFAKQNNRTPIFWDDMYLKHGGADGYKKHKTYKRKSRQYLD